MSGDAILESIVCHTSSEGQWVSSRCDKQEHYLEIQRPLIITLQEKDARAWTNWAEKRGWLRATYWRNTWALGRGVKEVKRKTKESGSLRRSTWPPALDHTFSNRTSISGGRKS